MDIEKTSRERTLTTMNFIQRKSLIFENQGNTPTKKLQNLSEVVEVTVVKAEVVIVDEVVVAGTAVAVSSTSGTKR